MFNILLAIRRSTWLAIKADARDDKLAARFLKILNKSYADDRYVPITKSSVLWWLIDLQVPPGRLDDLRDFLDGYPAAGWKVIGIWHNDSGLQLGQRHNAQGNVVGVPDYPADTTELLKYLPPVNTYDTNGTLVSSVPRTAAEDVHQWLGQAPRRYT